MNNNPRHQGTPSPGPAQPDAPGPNGYPTGYDDEGNFVEWIPDDENPGEMFGMVPRRSDEAIAGAYGEFGGRVCCNRHHVLKGKPTMAWKSYYSSRTYAARCCWRR